MVLSVVVVVVVVVVVASHCNEHGHMCGIGCDAMTPPFESEIVLALDSRVHLFKYWSSGYGR